MTLFQYLPDDCLYIIKQYLPSKFKVILEKNDLVDYIYSFLPLKDKMLINRKYYYQLQSQIIIPYEKEDKLMIDLVKKNCMIGVKKYVTKEKIDKLTKNKKYYFGNQVFFNLFSLLEQISIQYKYNQMREYLRTLLVNKKLNKYKNKVYKNIVWK